MPRFHFNFSDGSSSPDFEGHELPDVAAAKQAAIRFLGQSLCDKPQEFWSEGEWLLTVTDEGGLTLFSIRTVALDAPVLQATIVPAPSPAP